MPTRSRPLFNFLRAATACLAFVTTAQAAGGGSQGLLWKAASGEGVVYLLGSIHIADESVYPLSPAIEEAFAASDALVTEADTGPATEVALKAFLLEHGVYTDGTTLESHISPAALEAVKSFAAARELPWDNLARMRPWLLAGTLTVTEMGRLGFSSDLGLESHFLELAASKGKPVLYLERPEDQLMLLAGLSDPLQELVLTQALKDLDSVGESVRGIIEAWRHGDVDALEHILLDDFHDPRYEPLFEKIFSERNIAMTAALRGYLDEGGTRFVVVGSGHLIGSEGIVARLVKAGVKVERIGHPRPAPPFTSDPITESEP